MRSTNALNVADRAAPSFKTCSSLGSCGRSRTSPSGALADVADIETTTHRATQDSNRMTSSCPLTKLGRSTLQGVQVVQRFEPRLATETGRSRRWFVGVVRLWW